MSSKKEFVFYTDEKHTIWYRKSYTINAKSLEEAKALAINMAKEDDYSKAEYDDGWEMDMDTTEGMTPEENGNQATQEVYYEGEGSEFPQLIYKNA